MELKSVEESYKLANPEKREPDIGQSEQDRSGVSGSDRLNEERLQAIKDQMAAQGIRLTNDDLDGLRSYLATEQQWQEVYRRLAES